MLQILSDRFSKELMFGCEVVIDASATDSSILGDSVDTCSRYARPLRRLGRALKEARSGLGLVLWRVSHREAPATCRQIG